MKKDNRKELLAAYKEKKTIGGVCGIRHKGTGKMLVTGVIDIQAYKNRYDFSVSTGSCVTLKLQKDWQTNGQVNFEFLVLESMEQGKEQSLDEYKADIKALEVMIKEKIGPENCY